MAYNVCTIHVYPPERSEGGPSRKLLKNDSFVAASGMERALLILLPGFNIAHRMSERRGVCR